MGKLSAGLWRFNLFLEALMLVDVSEALILMDVSEALMLVDVSCKKMCLIDIQHII